MKKTVKMFIKYILCTVFVVIQIMTMSYASAEDLTEEDALRWLLTDQTGIEDFLFFLCDDYDGDGVKEAFAFVGYDSGYGYTGDIWFVSPYTIECVQSGCNYYYLEKNGDTAPMVLSAEEWYGGSGSTTHMWMIYNGEPYKIDTEIAGGISYGGNNTFYGYPSAFDMYSDGTGHTWKRYYFYLDGNQLREYGGIYITYDQFMMFDGAEEIIQKINDGGYKLGDIIYRANGIININISRDGFNDNMTLSYDETSVTDLEESYGGVYNTAYDYEMAVFPEEFIEPIAASADEESGEEETASDSINWQIGEPAVPSKQVVWDELGILNYNSLINIDHVECYSNGEYQGFDVYYMDDIFYGGSEWYSDEWLVDEGIFAEIDIDLDGDSVDEYMVMYVKREADEWDYISPRFRIAIYEPEAGGYVCTADFESNFDMLNNGGKCKARIVEHENGAYIVIASIYYGELSNGNVTLSVINYDGTNAYTELMMSINTVFDGYALLERIPVENHMAVLDMLWDAEYYAEEIAEYVTITDMNFRSYDPGYDVDYVNLYGNGSLEGFAYCAEFAKQFGINIYYELYDGEWSDWYKVYVDGGTVIAESGEEMNEAGSYNQLIFVTSLEHVVSESAVEELNEEPASTEEVKTGTVYFNNDSNLRDGPGLGYNKVSTIAAGKSLTWLGESSVDDRGVAWYKVRRNNGETAWTSSKYSTLVTDDVAGTDEQFAVLKKGSKGESVVLLQEYLKLLGYHTGSCDGDFGNQTKNSVEAFQLDYGFAVTGEVDKETWEAIEQAIN